VRFGVSTQLYHGQRLSRGHLDEIAANGFDTVEVVATRSHLDYHDPATLDEFARWLGDARLRLHSIHAPVTNAVTGRRWGVAFSNASPAEETRRHAVRETLAALELARRVPVSVLVVHPGLPDSLAGPGNENHRDAVRRSVEEIGEAADALGVRIALENIPSELATPESLVDFIDGDLQRPGVGTCLDFGHAHLAGGVADAAETMAGLLLATHVHDNHGARDEHLPPYEGTIAWETALAALRKVGYDGVFMLEVAPDGAATGAVLERIRRACTRLEDEGRSWS
jgi:sugar phosphate isomerase/epimerase